jgi:type IV pilus assembly protein PilE
MRQEQDSGIPRQRGFSLVELMTVVAILGIVLAIAIPNYTEYKTKGNRAAAQSFLMTIANKEEQYRLDSRSYTNTIGSGGLGLTAPTELTSLYTFTVTGAPTDFTATATAIGSQTADGNLTVNAAGAKTGKW